MHQHRTVLLATALSLLLALPAAAASVTCRPGVDATALLNQAAARGGPVSIGPGTCILSNSLFLPSGTTLTGAGIGRTILRADQGNAFNVIQIGGGTPETGAQNVDVSNLTLDGSAQAGGTVPHRSDALLVASGSSHVRIHDIEAKNGADNGIDVSGDYVDVVGNDVHENWHNGIYVIGLGAQGTRASYIRILKNRVVRNSLAALPGTTRKTFDGIDLDPRHAHCLVDGNTLEDNDIITLDHTPDGSFDDTISNNSIISRAITIDDAVGGDGIDIADNIDGFRVTGNRIENVRHFGIIVGGRPRNGVIAGNLIVGTTAEGILLRGGPGGGGITIANNRVWPGPDARGRAAIAVRHTANVRLYGNDLRPPPGAAGPPGQLEVRVAGPGLQMQ